MLRESLFHTARGVLDEFGKSSPELTNSAQHPLVRVLLRIIRRSIGGIIVLVDPPLDVLGHHEVHNARGRICVCTHGAPVLEHARSQRFAVVAEGIQIPDTACHILICSNGRLALYDEYADARLLDGPLRQVFALVAPDIPVSFMLHLPGAPHTRNMMLQLWMDGADFVRFSATAIPACRLAMSITARRTAPTEKNVRTSELALEIYTDMVSAVSKIHLEGLASDSTLSPALRARYLRMAAL